MLACYFRTPGNGRISSVPVPFFRLLMAQRLNYIPTFQIVAARPRCRAGNAGPQCPGSHYNAVLFGTPIAWNSIRFSRGCATHGTWSGLLRPSPHPQVSSKEKANVTQIPWFQGISSRNPTCSCAPLITLRVMARSGSVSWCMLLDHRRPYPMAR